MVLRVKTITHSDGAGGNKKLMNESLNPEARPFVIRRSIRRTQTARSEAEVSNRVHTGHRDSDVSGKLDAV